MQFIKLNYHRFLEMEPMKLKTEADTTQAQSEIKELGKVIEETGNKAQLSGKALSKSFASISISKDLRKTRKELKNNIRDLFADAKKMMDEGNTSGKFNLNMQTQMDKFAVADVSSDDRRKATQSEINKLLTLQKSLTTEISSENSKQIETLRKEFENEEKIRLSQEKILSLTKQTGAARQSGNVSNIFTELKGGINLLSNGVNSISNGFNAWIKHLTGIAVTFRILGGVVSGIAGSISSLYETAAGYQEAMNLYNTALGSYVDKASEWRDRISTALYLDPKQVMQYTGALFNLVQGLGATEDAAYTMSTNLTQLAYDMSSYLNIDVQSAYDKIQSAITGQSRAVASAGVALQQAALQEKLYSLGIKESIKNLNQEEKTLLRYIQIMDSTKNMQMDLGKTIITPENALRTIKTQFTLLAREIGNVFIPIVLKAVPYVMALTQALSELAKKLADWAGFEISDVDYSNALEGTDKINKKLKDTNKNAKDAKSSINRTLAAFDDLNVVESQSKSGKGDDDGAGIASKLEQYLKGYDMLGKLNDQFKGKVEEARKNLEKLWDVVKLIGVAFAGWKLMKLTGNVFDFANSLKTGFKEGKGFGGVIKTLALRFKDGYKYAKALGGGDGLGSIQSGIKNMLGPIGTVAAQFGLFANAMVGSAKEASKWNGEMDTVLETLAGPAGLTATLAIIGGIAFGPLTAAAVVIGGLSGTVIGLQKAYERMREEEEYQKAYDTLFDGQGISLNKLQRELENTFKPLSDYNEKTKETNDSVQLARDKVDEAKTAIENLHGVLESSTPEENKKKVDDIKTAYDNLRQSVDDLNTKEADRQIAQVDRLLKEGQITKAEHDKRVKEIKELSALQAAQSKGYYQQLADLEIKLSTGKITQDEYNKEVLKLATDYSLVAEHGHDLQLNMAGMYDVANKGFDLENPEKMKSAMEKLMTQYDELKNSTTNTYNASHDLNVKTIEDYDLQLATLQRMGKEGTKEYQTLQTAKEGLLEDDKKLTAQYETDMESIGATYKDVMLTMLAQIDAAGLTSNSNVADIVNDIKNNLDSLKDYDASKSTAGIFKSFATEFETNGGTFSQKATTMFATYASEIADKFDLGLSTGVQTALNNSEVKLKPSAEKYGTSIGGNITSGVGVGMTDNNAKNTLDNATSNMSKYTIEHTRDKFGIHSPSTVFAEIGNYLIEGLANGITNNMNKVIYASDKLVNKLTDSISKANLSFNITDNFNDSLNSMLSKLQKFCTNWRTAINKLISGTKTAMNGIKVDKDGKITYTEMPKVTVSKFKNGGFPTSGDLFFANEDGMPEYITSIGNRSAVANQDQMISALSGAIITAMSRIPTNTQPSNIAVYVGDKKLYEGQGEYQNRQNDRYGTTIVKI